MARNHSSHRWGQVAAGLARGKHAEAVAAGGVDVQLGRNARTLQRQVHHDAVLGAARSSPAWTKKQGGVCAVTRISGDSSLAPRLITPPG